jgi:CheY-like chemotaxis protein
MDTPETLRQKLQILEGKQFTGRVDVKKQDGKEWRLYFCLSRLVWADGGYHPYRAWQRLLKQHCPKLDHKLIDLNQAKQFECWNYYLLVSLLQRFLITKEQAILIIRDRILDVIFDIYQAESSQELSYSFVDINGNFPQESGLKSSIILLKPEIILKKIDQKWSLWREHGLEKFSPNFAPIIKNPPLLRQQINDNTYSNIVSLFNGKYPLKELARKLNLATIKILIWIKPYLDQDLIDLVEVRDIPLKVTLIGVSSNNYKITKNSTQTLIACIDDSVQVCNVMKHIITQAGYQYISVQDPLRALMMILRHKPDLIFLDLVMPIVNGYEICSQIRRVDSFKDVPIIILTSNDGMIDRIRSKMVGATSFLSKPVNHDKVLDKINSLLMTSKSKSTSRKLEKLELKTQTIS